MVAPDVSQANVLGPEVSARRLGGGVVVGGGRLDQEPVDQPPGFTGSAPGGPSRWNTARTMEWEPLKPVLVVEVRYDQITSGRFRHGTGFLRWRPDKDPKQCTYEQLAPELRPSQLEELFGS